MHKLNSTTQPVDSRTTLTIVKEILGWSDEEWKSREANLTAAQKIEMRKELDDLGELFGKMKDLDYNWRKAVLVCVPNKYLGAVQEHFLTASSQSWTADKSLQGFSPYCTHKNLLEHFYAEDSEQAAAHESHRLTKKHADLREMLVADLYKGLARVLQSRGETVSKILESLFWFDNNGDFIQEKSYKSHDWERTLERIGPYAYLLRDPESVFARDPIGARITTFIRQTSAENNLNNCPSNQICRQVFDDITSLCRQTPVPDNKSWPEAPLHALLLQNIGLNRAHLEYSAHYLDILDYAPMLIKSIEFYEKIGMGIENSYVESLGPRGTFDLPAFLMMLTESIIRLPYLAPEIRKHGFQMEQCINAIQLASKVVASDQSARKLLKEIAHNRGEDAADSVTLHLISMSTFCFIWFFLHNQQVKSRVYGRTHSGHSLLGNSLGQPDAQLQEPQLNLLKHIVMAVNRSNQIFEISAAHMHDYLRARAFNLATLTAKVAAIKRMELDAFSYWAKKSQFSDYLTKALGESLIVDLPKCSPSLTATL